MKSQTATKTAKSVESVKSSNTTLLLLGLVMLVNALSFGTLIPLLYPYAQRFGIGPFELSILFASFSLAQLIATPIIGRLSDRYGRKPLLLGSLFGTGISLMLFALSTVAWHLFVARILDGITGGNISVAQAMIADTTQGKDRAKAFGILGAAFGFGFLFGPALGGLLSQVSLTAPFWFASALAFLGTFLGWWLLPETLDRSQIREVKKEGLFHFGKMLTSLFDKTIGPVFLISLLVATAFNIWILGFQTTTVDVLGMTPRDVGILFSLSGVLNIFMQAVGIRVLLNLVPRKRVLLVGSLIVSVGMMLMHLSATSILSFAVVSLMFMVVSSPQNPVVSSLITERAKAEDQGGTLGLNQAYTSLGQIIGPLVAGVIAGVWVPGIFVAAAVVIALAAMATIPLFGRGQKQFDL